MEEANNSKSITKKEEIIQQIVKIFWVFLIGSIIGYIFEMIVALVQNGHFVTRQGLVIGPFIQVYGVGLVAYYLVLSKIKLKSYVKIFFLTMFLGGLVEYIFSYLQENIFGTISWDYSYLIFDINGRTSLLHCIYWGTGGILFTKFVLPLIEKMNTLCNKKSFKMITILLVIFIVFDILLSIVAVTRQEERKNNIPANGYVDEFLDKNYPDEKLKEIYSNAKEVGK